MNIYNFLKELNIKYEEISHKAIHTIEEALRENIPSKIKGEECKNLFLKSKNDYFLVLLEFYKKADLKELAKITSSSKLTFASIEELKNILNLNTGSVTPLGIINDKENKVTLILDEDLKNKKILIHPNTNTKTISLKFEDLLKIIEHSNHKYIIINMKGETNEK